MKTLRFRFTLVEVLAVVALISLLAAIGFGAYSYAMNASRESNSKALFKRIEAGLESCRTKFGYYPVSTSFTAISFTLKRDTSLVSAIQFGTDAMSSDYEKEFLRVVDEESLKKNILIGISIHILPQSMLHNTVLNFSGGFLSIRM